MRGSVAVMASLFLVAAAVPATAGERDGASFDRLAGIIRKACVELTRAPRDPRRVAIKLGAATESEPGRMVKARLPKLAFVILTVMGADDMAPAMADFDL